MHFNSIRIEGAILSSEILEKIDSAAGQKVADFGLDGNVKVKDEIVRAWADAQDYWRIFQRKLDNIKSESPATTETRNIWIVPLLGLLGYQLEYQAKGLELNGKTYAISHRVLNRSNVPVHIIGCREPAGLDRKPQKTSGRMSAHALMQEYLNLKDELYGIVTNGNLLRLLRDSSRLVKLTYVEFDLERIFSEGLFADFAIFYRLLHATRLPSNGGNADDCLIENYHQESLEFGSRIREGLSHAVEQAILSFANGFLTHSANDELRQQVASKALTADALFQHLLHLIYRILFLMVIEERNMVFPDSVTSKQQEIYRRYYSLHRLRLLAEKRYLADRRNHDYWQGLLATFRLFEADGPGRALGVAPLAGDLFGPEALGSLSACKLGNDVLLGCLSSLGLYQNPTNGQKMRVNYASLNVEEFGSVYEGLLEYEPAFFASGNSIEFSFVEGEKRSATGAHYTPDDLVQPLLRNSIDYLVAEKRKANDPEKALLSLRIADIACGSGHILLAAARRIATDLATVRTGEEQPSPATYRSAVRDVIHDCIYGVDLNPLAVELCKVALWLEAHIPGEPLNFLDHHIKCGNSIVGFMSIEELEKGVPEEAFAAMPGDESGIGATLRKRNKQERQDRRLTRLDLSPGVQKQIADIGKRWRELSRLPEDTTEQIERKKTRYREMLNHSDTRELSRIAAIPIAQFYIPKTVDNVEQIMTDADYRSFWAGETASRPNAMKAAMDVAGRKRFFHWFLEFPDIMADGGFDCILGNPPYMGGQGLSGTYGHSLCHYVKWQYAPTGLSDLVVYFLRRIYSLLKPEGITAIITTNSIKDGDIRKDGLEQVIAQGGSIHFAVRGIKWPGQANLVVSLVGIHKGKWRKARYLDGQEVPVISPYLENEVDIGNPRNLPINSRRMFQGSIFLGDGFLLSHENARRIIMTDERNREVIMPVINGDEVNNNPGQNPGRSIINFYDWEIEEAQQYSIPFSIVEREVKPFRATQNRARNRDVWWLYAEHRPGLTSNLQLIQRCFVAAATTKYLNFSPLPSNYIFLNTLYVFTTDRWDLYTVVQSSIHEIWARKYSGALETRLRYSPSDCFETYPFPAGLWQYDDPGLASCGERYHEYRRGLMKQLWLGLTDIYNLFHAKDLTAEKVAKVSKKPLPEAEAGYHGIIELRRLHRELDEKVLNAYGWDDFPLQHDFYEIDTLPENDRLRYSISPAARKELLRRLLELNHQMAAENTGTKPTKVKVQKKIKAIKGDGSNPLF